MQGWVAPAPGAHTVNAALTSELGSAGAFCSRTPAIIIGIIAPIIL